MNLELHRPELMHRIDAQMERRRLGNVDELLEQALDALDEKFPAPASPAKPSARNLAELFEPLRGLLSDEEVDTLFARNPSTSRPLDLS